MLLSQNTLFPEAQGQMEGYGGLIELQGLSAYFVDAQIVKGVLECGYTQFSTTALWGIRRRIKPPICSCAGAEIAKLNKAQRLHPLFDNEQGAADIVVDA